MVDFAELKAKAEKAKDASVTKVTNTKDKYSSVPASKTTWDPNWKRAPPPPAPRTSAGVSTSGPPPAPSVRSRPDVSSDSASAAPPPPVPRAARPDEHAPPAYVPLPPPTRSASGYPPSHRGVSGDALDKIDWINLSVEDKEEFFGWLDEFFSRYLNMELGPRQSHQFIGMRNSSSVPSARSPRAPPSVNMSTRPKLL